MTKFENVLVPSLFSRCAAFMVDEFNRFAFMAPFFMFVGLADFFERPASYVFWVLTLSWLLFYAYRVFCLYLLGGTVGKLLFGMRIVDRRQEPGTESQPLTLLQAGLRILADDLGIFLLGVPRAMMFLRLDRTQFSDWVAETKVISLRGGVQPLHRSGVLGLTLILVLFIFSFDL